MSVSEKFKMIEIYSGDVMSINIEKQINLLKTEACNYWGESEQNRLIQRSIQALEQLQKEVKQAKKHANDLGDLLAKTERQLEDLRK